MKHFFSILFLLFLTGISLAQERPRYELYQFNLKTINPAFTGISVDHTFNAQYFADYRNKEFPVNNLLISAESQFPGIKSGFGLIFETFKFYAQRDTKIKLQYSYQHELENNQILSFGLSINHFTRTVDYSLYQTLNPNDPLIFSDSESDSNLDLDIGIRYSKGNFLGAIGVNNLLKSKGGSDFGLDTLRNFHNIRSLTFFTQYELNPTDYLAATPSLFLHSFEDSDYSLDLNLNLKWIDLIITGFNYKITDRENFYSVFGGIEWDQKLQLILSKNHYPEDNWKNIELALNVHIPN